MGEPTWQAVNSNAGNLEINCENIRIVLRMTYPEAAALCAELLQVLSEWDVLQGKKG